MKKGFQIFTKLFIYMAISISIKYINAQPLKQGVVINIQQITNDETRYTGIKWSHDGTKISFTSDIYDGIYLYDFATKEKRTLTKESSAGFNHEWSLDDNHILYRATRYEEFDRFQYISAVDLNGHRTRMSSEYNSIQTSSWRYDQQVKYAILAEHKGLRSNATLSFDIDMDSIVAIRPSFNNSFLYREGELFLVDFKGSLTKLNNNDSFNPVFSPDGTKIAFTEIDELVVMNIDGTNRRSYGQGHFPSWVNSNQIVYEVSTDNGHFFLTGDIFMCNIETEETVNLTKSEQIYKYPSVSPDGNRIAFIKYETGMVYIMDLK